MSRKESQARKQAIADIKEDLKKEGKSFIGYIRELDPVMFSLSRSYIKAQNANSWCISNWAGL